MNRLDPFSQPAVHYLTTWLRTRIDAARSADRTLGASAIEWAIITAVAAVIAITVGGIIYNKVKSAAESTNTNFTPGGP